MNYLKGFFSFRGRINRAQYATILLLGHLLPGVFFLLTETYVHATENTAAFIVLAFMALMLWVVMSAMAKRFHDIDQPGRGSLLVFVPVVGTFALFALLFYRGNEQQNRYGSPPIWFGSKNRPLEADQ
jgi:uncharacterized membrane protein YhaH (DUF805 family)